jgi:signal transduction histidine kinase
MKTATRPKNTVREHFDEAYVGLIREYAGGGGESALGRVYELGRRAITEKKSLLDIAAVHHKALQSVLAEEKDSQKRAEIVRLGANFLAECMSPYEMAYRGFQDAVQGLRQINETLEAEIKRIAYAVHDEAGQLLVAVHLALAEMETELAPAQHAKIKGIEKLLNEVEGHLRRYSHELRPTILDDLGWIPAIRFLAEGISKRHPLNVEVDAKVQGRFSSSVETTLYRVVQEALNNTVKHAKARNVWIRTWQNKGVLYCSVKDDGVGFESSPRQREPGPRGLGLVAMQERVSAIGGVLQVESNQGRGTEVRLQLSLEGNHHANPSSTRR